MSLYPDQHPVSACQRPQATPNLLPYWETSIRIRTITYLDLSATIWGNVTLASNLSSFFATLNFEHIPIQTKMSWSCGCSVQKLFSSVWGRADYSAECWPGKTLQLLRSSAWSIIIITTGGFYISPPPCPPAHSSLWCVVVRGTHSNHSHTLQSSIHSTQNILSEPVCKQPSELTHPTTEHSTLNKIFCFSRIIFLVFREIEKRSRTVHRGQWFMPRTVRERKYIFPAEKWQRESVSFSSHTFTRYLSRMPDNQ